MIAPLVASAVAPKVVESTTNEQGLINQAFKITILIGLVITLAFTAYILYSFFGFFGGVVDFVQNAEPLTELKIYNAVSPKSGGLIGYVVGVPLYLITAFGRIRAN